MSARSTARALLVTAAIVFVAALAAARPGGGQSFGGSRSGSSSSSSSGGSRSGSSSSSSSGSFRSGSSSSTSSSSSGGSSSFGRSTSSSSSSSSSSGGFGSTSSSAGGTSSAPYTAPYSAPVPYSPPLSGDGYTSEGAAPPPRDKPVFLKLLGLFVAGAVLVILVLIYSRWRDGQRVASWEATVRAEEDAHIRATRHASITAALAAIRSGDDAFSVVLFEDFLYALYAEVHTARATGQLARLAPYLSGDARAKLEELPANGVDGIVIGGMRLESISTAGTTVVVDVVFTTNLAEKDPAGKPAAVYMEERWRLSRDAAARSRPPARARIIGCPSCGAPLDKTIGQTCGYCGATSKPGEIDWFVESVEIVAREDRGPMLTGTTEEVGTDWPTVVDPDAKRELEALRARDPAFAWPAFVSRVTAVFSAFHASWSSQDLRGVRPYLSDNLFELQEYWVRAYQQQQLRNQTENAMIVTVHLARVSRDRFFDAVTVRVFASCLDYTTDASGHVVAGDRRKPREYSEYWTFIRGSGKSATPRSDGACPSCGASLAGINMAGTCTHCNAKITSGEFDWVLSRIEQDEVYEAAA